ncbi:terminase large subunit domain-containing protein, partial [Endozoicomonas sp. SESOKO1]|uniref:terminase large subunit domain-containing protein n=1 Tax=Endozoicomonas sp. SESOKO1 TaxID=2828742 RepID=UPI002148A256
MARHWEDAWHYANRITDGEIAACKWVRLACQRFIDDMHHGHQRGLAFSPDKAQDILDYYNLTPHIKGEWAGQPITPSDWQTFALVNLFGWYRADGTRRFRSAYIEVGRKNGKSTFVAPVGLYMLKEDGEAGSEVYSAATSRDQARIVFDDARDMT